MRKKIIHLVFGGMLLLTLAACGGNNEEIYNSKLSGDQLYAQTCSGCHGSDLRKGYAPDLDKIGQKHNAEEIENIIVNGYGDMPKGLLKGQSAKKVAEWLATQK